MNYLFILAKILLGFRVVKCRRSVWSAKKNHVDYDMISMVVKENPKTTTTTTNC